MNKDIISKLINLVNENEELHYIEIAFNLLVSPSTAQRYAVLFSRMFENYVEYNRGVLRRKKLIGLENLDDETRIKALQRTLDSLRIKLKEVKVELNKIISNDFEHLTKEEIREKIKSLLERI